EILHRRVESGKGCILLGSHLGSFEVLRTLGVTQQNFSLKVLMDIAHNENITRFLDALNPEMAKTVIVPDQPDTLLRVKESLDAGLLLTTGSTSIRFGINRRSVEKCKKPPTEHADRQSRNLHAHPACRSYVSVG